MPLLITTLLNVFVVLPAFVILPVFVHVAVCPLTNAPLLIVHDAFAFNAVPSYVLL